VSVIEVELDLYIMHVTRQEMIEEILVKFYGWIVL
jgi:hypothetical protein